VDSNEYHYRIDSNDRIQHVSTNWTRFASENQGNPTVCDPDILLGQSLWDFITGLETLHLYQHLVKAVRAGQVARGIPFRCDSPQQRRFLELDIVQGRDGDVEFRSTVIRSEQRAGLRLLDLHTPRTLQFVRVCSMCKCLAVPPNQWLELEEGLKELRVFEAERMPQLTHGLCPTCFHTAMAVLPGYAAAKPAGHGERYHRPRPETEDRSSTSA